MYYPVIEMSEIPWDTILARLGMIVISVVALYVSFMALTGGYLTTEQFWLVLWSILGAWGIAGGLAGTYSLGKKSGYQQGYYVGLKEGLELKKER